MSKEQQLHFLKSQFSQLVRAEAERKQQEILKDNRLQRVNKLNISHTINEIISVSPEKINKLNALSTSRASDNQSQKIAELKKNVMN